jgi:ribonuclease BN (tRNA processing enzyme)
VTLTLTVLGCDGSHAGAGGSASGYLVRSWSSGTSVWVDAGPGTFANLQRFCTPLSLTAIVLTHEHLDHWSDLSGFLVASRYAWGPPPTPIRVYAPPGLSDLIQEYEGIVRWCEVGDGDGADVGDLRLRFSRTDHPPPTLAVRVEGAGRALAYTSDSGPGWSVGALGPDIDLALCEATYTAAHEGTAGHMSGRQAGSMARAAGVRRLVITHRWPTVPQESVEAEATEAFGGRVVSAAVGHGYSL